MLFSKPVVDFYSGHVYRLGIMHIKILVGIFWNPQKKFFKEKLHSRNSFFVGCENLDSAIHDDALVFASKVNGSFGGIKLAVFVD